MRSPGRGKRSRQSGGPVRNRTSREAYLKLVDQSQVRWESRAQFFTIASQVMRSILIANARYFSRQKLDHHRPVHSAARIGQPC
jgi:hypothetical protein